MSTASPAPDVVRTLCPGCGRTDGVFPCPRCDTPQPTACTPQPAESTAPAVLFLGVSLFLASGLFLVLVPPPYGPAGGVILGAVGTAMSGLATWALRDPPRPWQVVADGAVGIGVVQKGALQYTHGRRTRRGLVDPADHADLAPLDREALKAGLTALLDAPEKTVAALPALQLLARVARGEARAELTTITPWADGQDQAPEVDVEDLRAAPEDLPAPAETDEADPIDALRAWQQAHPVLWNALTTPR